MGKKHKQQNPPRDPHLAYSVKKAGLMLGVGKASIYHLISTGALWTITIGNRRLVPRSALEGFIESTVDVRKQRMRLRLSGIRTQKPVAEARSTSPKATLHHDGAADREQQGDRHR
jgi:excisionase family DNA binding protein